MTSSDRIGFATISDLTLRPHVLRRGLGEQIGGLLGLRRNDGGPNRVGQARQVTGKRGAILDHLDGRVDGATLAVAEHHDERNTEHGGAVFEAGEAILVDEVSGHAHDEQLARTLVEGELGSKAGIRAAHDAGERILRLRAGDASGRVVPVGRRIGGIAGVALLQARKRLIGADGVRRRRGRLRPRRTPSAPMRRLRACSRATPAMPPMRRPTGTTRPDASPARRGSIRSPAS